MSLASFWVAADNTKGWQAGFQMRRTWDVLRRSAAPQQLGPCARCAGDGLLLGEIQQDASRHNGPALAAAPVVITQCGDFNHHSQ